MSDIFTLADRYIDSFAALDPIAATGWGIRDHDHRLTDYSPQGHDAVIDLLRSTLRDLDRVTIAKDSDRVAKEVMRERLQTSVDQYVAGESERDLSVLRSPHGSIRQAFDLMRLESDDEMAAAAAFGEHGEWLQSTYAPATTAPDAVGADRYALRARGFNGADLDLYETYDYGWSELRWIELRMAELADQILPGGSLAAAVAHIEADPRYVIDGVDEFQRWNQELIDTTMPALDGVHFDIAEPIKRCEAMIAPSGGAAAMYYTGPSEDFSRPGRTWYPTMGKTRFPLWREVSICYHEGVPGHHLQIAQMRYQSKTLTRFQRLAGLTSGYAEGWALYAERLMHELGYLDDPVYELGWLSSQAMRAVRIVVDIGMHLQLRIPMTERYHPGEVWTPELALPFVIERSCFPADFMASEVDRYLGLPGQAITYKVGERVWLHGRADLERRMGSQFDLKHFHRDALNMGGMGLDQLASELTRLADRG